jgi:phosphopantothenoylcysteine decarboxylase/phosphopantothenate--cysteine ligase
VVQSTTNILLGISGGIAAYKTPDLVRRLRERGAVVQVVMTRAAASFVTPLSLQAVSGRAVRSALLDPRPRPAWTTSSWRAGPIICWWRQPVRI